ncbi:Major intrinsic protein [Desulfosarcina cetonica]|uniref:MIP/aquaporin family protein n=1 Tax=Desulfosarcina cetonica TaxID=90730 RepID=UPI0009FB093C|nr:aquaporin [Desulfosarcina cetonica]VTR66673.1 Major intrinsic protein [Desulfosarcina cetonica]
MNRYIAEGIGTFALVFTGCGAIIVNDTYNGMLGHVGVSLSFGLVVMAMIYSVGNISGAHINPAVTLGFLFAGRLERKVVLPYISSQVLGAVLAAIVLRLLLPGHETLGATIPTISMVRSFLIEVLLSFLLMFVILNVSTGHMEKGIMAGVAVGGIVALEALMGGPMTGASMNPARSLGPALISGKLNHIWIYVVAPIVGTFLAHPTCRWIQGNECCSSKRDPEIEA